MTFRLLSLICFVFAQQALAELSPEDLAKQIITEFQAGNRKSASSLENLALLQKATQEQPDNPLTHFALALCHSYRDDQPAVTASMEKAYATSGKDPQIALMYILALKINKEPLKARAVAEELVKAHPAVPQIIVSAAMLDIATQRYEPAVKALEKLRPAGKSSTANDQSAFLLQLGSAYLFQGDHVNAITTLEESNRLRPDTVPAQSALGHAYLKNGELEKAAQSLDAALAINSKYPAALYYRGLCHEKAGDAEKARELFEQSYNHGKSRLRDNGEDYFIQAECCAKLSKPEEAEDLRKQASELSFTFDAPWRE